MSTVSVMEHGALLEHLLSGAFICPITHEEWFRQLQDDQVVAALDEYLQPLNRRVVFSDESNVAFLGWRHITPDLRERLSQQLRDIYRSLLPLLDWLLLVQEVLGRDGIVTAGDILKPAEFVLICEDNTRLRQRLRRLATDRFFNSSSEDVSQQVRQIFKRLQEQGYVIQPSAEQQLYRVTGKIEYLIEIVRFLKDEEGLPIDEDTAVQTELYS